MLVLYETSLGFCLFQLSDKGRLDDAQLSKKLSTPEGASNLLKLQSIHRFSSTADAVEDITAISDGKLSKNLKKFLTTEIVDKAKKDTLIVGETKLGTAIAKKLAVNVISDSTTQDLFRGIREQIGSLLGDVNADEHDLSTMALGLSHSLSRYKLKFSPDKVDTMIVQAIALLDDLDKEINIYAMRTKEWYGWHFPEMAKIISDNLAYAKCIKAMGFRDKAASTDFSEILPEDLEAALKQAAQLSMGTEISITDLTHINLLAEQVVSITQYRSELYEYLRNRMAAIAPNLTAIVGDLVGARLIAHSGSLLSLAKAPASTIQILGAEKALFRALKTKHDTPKYGLIFHASLIGQAPQQLKGKMARMTAGKTALAIRYDALADADTRSEPDAASIGIKGRAKLEARLRHLELGLGITSVRRATTNTTQSRFQMTGNGAQYNPAADILIPTQTAAETSEAASKKDKKRKSDVMEVDETNGDDDAKDKAARKEAKRQKKAAKEAAKAAAERVVEASTPHDASTSAVAEVDEEAAKAERKRQKKLKKAQGIVDADTTAASEAITEEGVNGSASKKSKKRKHADGEAANGTEAPSKKKKRKSEAS